MPLLTHPTRPKPPRLNKRKQIVHQDSDTTLREDHDDFHQMDMDMDMRTPIDAPMIVEMMDSPMDYGPPVPPKLDTTFDFKQLPTIPHDSPIETYAPEVLSIRPLTPPSKQSTGNRWKSAVGKFLTLRKGSKSNKVYMDPPLSPASSRQPSFYVPPRRVLKQRSAVTLLSPISDSQDGNEEYDDDDGITNIGLSPTSARHPPVTPITLRGGPSYHHLEPISAVMQRMDMSPIATPISPMIPPVRPRLTSNATQATQATQVTAPSITSVQTRPEPTPSPSPPPPSIWTSKSNSSRLYVANPSPAPSPPPAVVKKMRSMDSKATRPPTRTTTPARAVSARAPPRTRSPRPQIQIHPATPEPYPPVTNSQKRVGPRILQAQLPSPVTPDYKQHVFTGPWHNRQGDEWIGISATPGEYRVRQAKEGVVFDTKGLEYPEELHCFMNPMGDIMDALTLAMIRKGSQP